MSLPTITSKQTFSVLEYEEIFLGAIVGGVIDAPYILKVKKEYFSKSSYQLFDVIQKLNEQGGVADYLSILAELAQHRSSADAKVYLKSLIDKVPNEFNPTKAIELIEESFIRRNTAEIVSKLGNDAQQNPKAAAELAYRAYENIERLTEVKAKFDIKSEFTDTVQNIMSGDDNTTVVKTGFANIDKVTGGLSRGEVTIIAGRPGHGKTTSAIALAKQIVRENSKAKVILFECEMSLEMLKRKMLASESGVSSYRMRINQVPKEDESKLIEAATKLSQYQDRLYIFDNVFDLFTMHKIARGIGADVVMIDFLNLMDDIDEKDKRNCIGAVMKSAKRFAKTHNMNYVIFAQLNRGQEIREDKTPTTADLAEADYIGWFASEVWLLYYPFKYTRAQDHLRKLKIIFDKARYTGIGDAIMYFDPDLCIMRDK